MNIKNKTFLFALMLIASSSVYADLKILEDGKDKSSALNSSSSIILKDDMIEKRKIFDEKKKLQIKDAEDGIYKDEIEYMLNPITDKNVLGRTGIIFDYSSEAEDKAEANKISGKGITIINGGIFSEAMPYSYEGTKRTGIIENSDIGIVYTTKPITEEEKAKAGNEYNDKMIEAITYLPGSSDLIAYSDKFSNEEKSKAMKDAKYRRYYFDENEIRMPHAAIDVYNSNIIFKNSKIKFESPILNPSYVYYNDEDPTAIKAMYISPFLDNPSSETDVIIDRNYAGVEFQRDTKNPDLYDLDTNGGIFIESFNFLGDKNIFEISKRPFLVFGENTRVRAGILNIAPNRSNLNFGLWGKIPLSGPEENRAIIFEKNSEVTLRKIAGFFANIFLNGGKLTLGGLRNDPVTGKEIPMTSDIVQLTQSRFRGSAILDVYAGYWNNLSESTDGGRPGHYTNLTALPESKIDLNYFSNGRNQGSYLENIESLDDVEAQDKGQLFKFTFKDNTDLYLSQVSEADIVMDKGSRLHLYREMDKDVQVENPDPINWVDHKWAKFYGKEDNPNLLTPTEKYSSLNNANTVQFRQKLELNDAHIYFRTNIVKELSDKLVVKNNVITGSGTTTLHIKNQGSADTTGNEKVVLIEAKQGVDSGVSFSLDKPSIELGAYEYFLSSDIIGDEKVYYLSNKFKDLFTNEKIGEKTNLSTVSKPSTSKNISPIVNEDFNLTNDSASINSKEGELAIDLISKKANIDNSTLVTSNGKGIELKDSPLNIKNSNVFVEVEDAGSGLLIKDSTNVKVLNIQRDKDSLEKDSRDLYVNGKLAIESSPKAVNDSLSSNISKANVEFGKGTKVEVYNPKGDVALALKDAFLVINDNATTLKSNNQAFHSENSQTIGNGVFNIEGKIVHSGNGGIDLTLKEGSVIDSKIIDIAKNDNFQSKLHFEKGTDLRVEKRANIDIVMDKGSNLYLYSKEQGNEKLFDNSLRNRYLPKNTGNSVIFSGRVELNDVDLFTRVNLIDSVADKMIVEGKNGILTGTGATIRLVNVPTEDISNLNLRSEIFRGKMDPNFKWNISNELEVGSYIYDAKLNLKEVETDIDETTGKANTISVLSYELRDKTQRKSRLTSTADSFIENTFADYYTELGAVDTVFRGIDNINFDKKTDAWAKVDGTTLTTKNEFKSNGKAIFAGIDRQLLDNETLHGGVFFGDSQYDKSYSKFGTKGKTDVFHAGIYLSYRGTFGDADFFVKYAKGKSDYDTKDTSGDNVSNKYDYTSKMVGVRSAKKLYLWSNDFYVEPAIKLSFGEIDGVESKASNGLNTRVKNIRTWSTGGELRVGYSKNSLNAYTKIGVSKEFLGDVDINFNQKGEEKRQLDEGMLTLGAGVEYSLGNHSVSLEGERKQSKLLKDFYRVSLGYKYKF